jgi:hypothetical protein
MQSHPSEVSTSGLRSELIPEPDGPLNPRSDREPDIWRFAQTFDVNSFATDETCLFLARSARHVFTTTGTLPKLDLDAYRACLAVEYQQWRARPDDSLARGSSWAAIYFEHAAFVAALVREIHKQVWEEEQWWWEPNKTPTDDERTARALSRSRQPRQLARLLDLAGEHISEHHEVDLVDSFADESDPYVAMRAQAAYFVALGLVESGGQDHADVSAYGMAARLRGIG